MSYETEKQYWQAQPPIKFNPHKYELSSDFKSDGVKDLGDTYVQFA